MKFARSVRLLACTSVIAGGLLMAASSFVVVQSSRAQDSSSADSAVSNLSGSWQMTWAGPNGNQRQVTMQIKQDGKKLSGTLQGERGSAPLKGTCEGNQVSFSMKMRKREVSFTGTVNGNKMSGTTEQGASWSATRQQ